MGLLRIMAVFTLLGAVFGGVRESAPPRVDLDALVASAGCSQDVVNTEDFDDDVLGDEVADVQPDDELSIGIGVPCGAVHVSATVAPTEHRPGRTPRPEGPFRPPRIALL